MEGNRDIKNVFKNQGNISCLKDVSENGGDLIHFNTTVSVSAGKSERYCSKQVHFSAPDPVAYRTDNCCRSTGEAVPGVCAGGAHTCEESERREPLTTSAPCNEQAEIPAVNHCCFVKEDSENSGTLLEIHPKKSLSNDFSDDNFECFECSDVLTRHENEIWEKKLQFLLESDDEDDLKLSKDCDGCAYFLGELPCLLQVSDNTAPMDATIGFCGHHSKFKGVNVRRDPSARQATLQSDMTLTVGAHQDKAAALRDREKYKLPVASAAIENDYPGIEEGKNGSGHSAADVSTNKSQDRGNLLAQVDSSATHIGASLANQATEAASEKDMDEDLPGDHALQLEEERRTLSEEKSRHAVCTLAENLRRNLLKLLNPKELCRYVSSMGQPLQPAAAAGEGSEEGAVAARIRAEPEGSQGQPGPCQRGEADKDCHWEWKRTWGLCEQNQVPDESVSSRSQDASPNNFSQNDAGRCMEPGTEEEAVFMPGESAVSTEPASEMLCPENALRAKDAALQTYSQHHDPCHESESHQQEFPWEQGINTTSNGSKSTNDISACSLWDAGSAPDRQEYLCALQSPAKLCNEPEERGQRGSFDSHRSNDTDALHVVSCAEYQLEAGGETVQESGEDGHKRDADLLAVHDRLWKLLVEADSDWQVPFENRGITSLEIRPKDVTGTGLSLVREACPGHPVSVNLREEQEPIIQPARRQRTEKEDCSVSSTLLKTDEACNSACIGNISFLQGVETVGTCQGSSTGNKKEPPATHISANRVLSVEKCLERKTDRTLTGDGGSAGMSAAQEGTPPASAALQTHHGDSPQRVRSARSRDEEKPPYMSDESAGRLLHTDQNISLIDESITKCTDADTGEHSSVRDCYSSRNELAFFPEQKDFFPRNYCDENVSQFAHDEHFSVEAIPKSTEENLQGKGNHSDLNTQSDMNSDCYRLSKNDCKDFQVVSSTQNCSYLMKWPDLSETPETRTCRNLPQNIHQGAEIEGHKEAFIPSNEDPFLADFLVEVPQYERNEQKAGASCGTGVRHVSEGQPADSPHRTSEQHVLFVDQTFKPPEMFKTNSSQNHARAPGHTTPLSTAEPGANEQHEGTSDQVGIQPLTVGGASPFLVPLGHLEGSSTSTSAMGCSNTGSPAQTESTQTAVKVDENLNKLEFFPEALQGQFHNVPQKNKDETVLQGKEEETQSAEECNPSEAVVKPLVHALALPGAREQPGGAGGSPARSEVGLAPREDRKEQRRLLCRKDSKAPKLVKRIQAELFPDCSGNIKLCCQFGDIHGDSTVTWTKDSKLLARLQRSAQDDTPISLAIAKASSKDQGMYYCCLKNIYGKVTAEFNLTSEVLEHLSSFQNFEGLEEIEFMQLMFREDSISDSYFGGNLRGAIATEELHFGEGMHRKAFRSRVLRGLVPLFGPGHPCVLKVHSAIMYGARSKDDLVQKNYKLALQECHVQNTAREYAKIYAAEAEPLEGFGEVPEIIPIFLVHRPANNIPYATVEEELVGEFVKYSVKDGKEINFLRRDSEAGQKCCTFQHWVYERTNGSLLVTDLQGVGMKLTDVGIATLTKGYKGFKGNCSVSFIEQFKVLHQCNKYCEMLGLKSLQTTHQKQRKPTSTKSKTLPNSATVKKAVPSAQDGKRAETSLLRNIE
ncbi:PREDICTED: alpha-protein kinase 2 [Tinamus guttatus]|nr:PREDICTED: alpha-protein kinase 2 [Tinamus guttatus]